jgi:hypothetical protein
MVYQFRCVCVVGFSLGVVVLSPEGGQVMKSRIVVEIPRHLTRVQAEDLGMKMARLAYPETSDYDRVDRFQVVGVSVANVDKYADTGRMLRDFIDECCVVSTQYKTGKAQLLQAVNEWRNADGSPYQSPLYFLTRRELAYWMMHRSGLTIHNGARDWIGIGLIEG